MNSDTPRTDAWCELAMNADVSAVLDLAKQFERELNLWRSLALSAECVLSAHAVGHKTQEAIRAAAGK